MYDICHPTYYNMSQLGCNDQVKLTTAFYVYMELCEVKRYWDVEYKYKEELQLFYLKAKKHKNAPSEVFIPWPAIHNITLDYISNIQHELEEDRFTLVFKEGDTTSVYYSIGSGIIKPNTPDESKLLRMQMEKKLELEKEIKRNTSNLYERALSFENGETDQLSQTSGMKNEEESEKDFFTPVGENDNIKTDSAENKFSNESLASNDFFHFDTNNFDNSVKQESVENSSSSTNQNECTEKTEASKDLKETESSEISENLDKSQEKDSSDESQKKDSNDESQEKDSNVELQEKDSNVELQEKDSNDKTQTLKNEE